MTQPPINNLTMNMIKGTSARIKTKAAETRHLLDCVVHALTDPELLPLERFEDKDYAELRLACLQNLKGMYDTLKNWTSLSGPRAALEM